MAGLSRTQSYKLVAIIFIQIVVLSIVFFSGKCEYFAFNQIAPPVKFEALGYILMEDSAFSETQNPFPGFYAIAMSISLLASISYAELPFMFIQLFPILAILFSLFCIISQNRVLSALSVFLMIISSLGAFVLFWPHGIGFVLFIASTLVVVLLLDRPRRMKELTLLLLVLIVSIQYISYKATAWVFGLLLFSLIVFQFSGKIGFSFKEARVDRKFLYSALIGLICIVIFNQFYMVTFSSLLQYGDLALGFESLLIKLNAPNFDPLQEYNIIHYNMAVSAITYIKVLILLMLIAISLCSLVGKFFKKDMHLIHFVMLSFLVIAVINLFIYGLRGLFDPTFLVYSGFIAVLMINWTSKLRFIQYGLIAAFIIASLTFHIVIIKNDLSCGDDNHFEYLSHDSEWVIKHMDTLNIKADVVTEGYYLYQTYTRGRLTEDTLPRMFNEPDVISLLNYHTSQQNTLSTVYAVNYREEVLSLGWKYIKGFKYFKTTIDRNIGLNKIYTSDFVGLYQR